MQNRERLSVTIGLIPPNNLETHAAVETHCLFILFINIYPIGTQFIHSKFQQVFSVAFAPCIRMHEKRLDLFIADTDKCHRRTIFPDTIQVCRG